MPRDTERRAPTAFERKLGRCLIGIGIVVPVAYWFLWKRPLDLSLIALLIGLAVSFSVVGAVAILHARLRDSPPSRQRLDQLGIGVIVAAACFGVVSLVGAWIAHSDWEVGLIVMGVGYALFAGAVSAWLALRT